jgi:hypoxanthine phosphoribosyltransferase
MHRIAKQIEDYQFDWYIAISRGGLIPTALLAQITICLQKESPIL